MHDQFSFGKGGWWNKMNLFIQIDFFYRENTNCFMPVITDFDLDVLNAVWDGNIGGAATIMAFEFQLLYA